MSTKALFARDALLPPDSGVWIGGDHESSKALGIAFMGAADTLATAWRDGPKAPSNDRLALPIIQNYRHCLELFLKAGCEKTAELIDWGWQLGLGEDVRPADLQDRLGRTHSISELVLLLEQLTAGLAQSGEARMPAETAEMLRYLHDLDERGLAFRYASRKVGKGDNAHWEPVRPEATLLDLDNAIMLLHDAAQMLKGGMMGYLAAYEDFLQDMWSEYRSQIPDGY